MLKDLILFERFLAFKYNFKYNFERSDQMKE